jgi:predicted N-acyltransferase
MEPKIDPYQHTKIPIVLARTTYHRLWGAIEDIGPLKFSPIYKQFYLILFGLQGLS